MSSRLLVVAAIVGAILLLPLVATRAAPQARERTLPLQGYSSIGLTRLKSGHLVLNARINGVPGRFVLDTGAGRSILETARHTEFKLTRIDATEAVAIGAGGNVPLQMSHGNRLQIGGFIDHGFTAYLMPLDRVNLAFMQRGQQRIDGVIGTDVLRNGAAVIDYAGNILYLKPKPQAAPASPPPARIPSQR